MRVGRQIAIGGVLVLLAAVAVVGWLVRAPQRESIAPYSASGSLAPGDEASTVSDAGVSYRVVAVDLAHTDIGLVWRREDGSRIGRLDAAAEHLRTRGRQAVFVTNAGIFDPSYKPLGLHVEDGATLIPLNTADGEGNFFLKPNGVFAIVDGKARVMSTDEASTPSGTMTMATQSGPLLVRAGMIHPAFRPDSENRRVRSGVGLDTAGRVVFALSERPTTFHAFATLFRERLNCPDALYLDGDISRFLTPGDTATSADDQPSREFAGILVVTRK